MSKSAKVLVVEDELIVATSIAQNLERASYEVVGIAVSAEEALTAVAQKLPDLVLMDIRIKGPVDGVDTAIAIHDRFQVPIIFLTAHAEIQTDERTKAAKPFGYLVKPVANASLMAAVETAISKSVSDRQLETHRAWLATTMRSTTEAMVVTDTDDRVQFLSQPAEKLLHANTDEALGRKLEELFHPPPLESYKTRGLHEAVSHDSLGRPVGRVITLSAPEPAEVVDYLATLLEWSDDAIIAESLAGIITAWNSAAERIFGYRANEVIGQPISILAPYRGSTVALSAEPPRSSLPAVVRHETLLCRKEGRDIPVLLTVSAVRDAGGRLVGVLKIVRDISEWKDLERKLERARQQLEMRPPQPMAELEAQRARLRAANEERFRLVVEAAPNAMVMVGADGHIALINSQTEKLFGYARSELLGQPVEILVPERFRSAHGGNRASFFHAPTARAMGTGRDLFALRKDGAEVPVEIGLNPISSPDGEYVLASIIDITERKISENSLRRSLNEKQALLQEVHHRVKNNLYIISSLLSMQTNSIRDPETVAKLRDSERRVLSMAMIHEQLYQHDDMSSIDLAEYARDLVVQLFSTYSPSSLITYRLEAVPTNLTIEQSIPCGLILNELITNALKYAYPGGRGEILIRIFVESGRVWMIVSDDGVGMPSGFDLKRSNSLGMNIIDVLTIQLEGQLNIGVPPGASFSVDFPGRPIIAASAALSPG